MNMNDNAEDDVFFQQLRHQRDKLEAEIASLQVEIEAKEMARRGKETQLGHITALLAAEPSAENKKPSQSRRGYRASDSTQTPQLMDMAVEVLRRNQGDPMHYREIADALLGQGAVIKGKDAANGLLSRMTRDERFVRPTSKGFYALREDYPNARNVGAKRRGKGKEA